MKKVILAYSGGLDTSVILKWLQREKGCEVVTFTADVGQQEDLKGDAELVYNGYWFSPEREALQTYMDHVAKSVSGLTRLKLLKGNCTVVGRRSDTSLYDMKLATFEAEDVYNQADAEGFIKINSLRLRAQSHLKQKVGLGHD